MVFLELLNTRRRIVTDKRKTWRVGRKDGERCLTAKHILQSLCQWRFPTKNPIGQRAQWFDSVPGCALQLAITGVGAVAPPPFSALCLSEAVVKAELQVESTQKSTKIKQLGFIAFSQTYLLRHPPSRSERAAISKTVDDPILSCQPCARVRAAAKYWKKSSPIHQ